MLELRLKNGRKAIKVSHEREMVEVENQGALELQREEEGLGCRVEK